MSSLKNGRSTAETLEAILPASADRNELRDSVIPAILKAIWGISKALRNAHHVALVGSANAFGDDQLNVDVETENILRDELNTCAAVATVSSEEDPVEKLNQTTNTSTSSEKYTVAFDPLDGSSIIAPNWSVGTIVGIWDGVTAVGSNPREKQIASILGVYGPRTTAVVAVRLPGTKGTCFEVAIDSDDSTAMAVIRTEIALSSPPFKTRYFAPANLRAAAEDTRYNQLISTFISEKYTLRYSGGLVPDAVHALVKGHGTYMSPVTAASAAKLRRLYELCPVALVVECVGGKAVDPRDGSGILDVALGDVDERGGLVCGTADEVDKVMLVLSR